MQGFPLPPLTLGGAAQSSAGLSGDSGMFNASGRSINFAGSQDVKGTGQATPQAGGVPVIVLVIGAAAVLWMLLKR